MIYRGSIGPFFWAVSNGSFQDLTDLIRVEYPGLRACVTAIDSGPLTLSAEEISLGWIRSGDVAVSPPIGDSLHIPLHEYGECYVLDAPPPPGWAPEVFVNYFGFTLRGIEDLRREPQASSNAVGFDWLPPVQARFWKQLEEVSPAVYVASGDYDLALSPSEALISRLIQNPTR